MKLSIIIPSYNRVNLLKKTLDFLKVQYGVEQEDYEIVIVDDGSDDNTLEFCKTLEDKEVKIKYFHRKRDELSCRARARNIGIKNSTGDILTFLDTGILVPNNFVASVLHQYKSHKQNSMVVYHYVLGMYIDPEQHDTSILADISPNNITAAISELSTKYEWLDRREGLFNISSDSLDGLSAPWSIGWTAAYSVPKSIVEAVGGFDSEFLGWGAEDTDLSYRLFKNGASFYSSSNLKVIHIPHKNQAESESEKRISNQRNEYLLHRKNYEFDTEIYLHYPGPYFNQVLTRFENLPLQYVTPWYSTELINNLKSLVKDTRKSAVVGSDTPNFVNGIVATDLFVQSKKMISRLKELTNAELHYLLGISTPFDDNYFDIFIVTDFVRLLSEPILIKLFAELMRISKKVIFLYTDNFNATVNRIDGHPWQNLNEISSMLKNISLRLENINKIEQYFLYEISSISC